MQAELLPINQEPLLRRLHSTHRFPEVRLVQPVDSGFLLLAAEIDSRPPFLGTSRLKRTLLAECTRLCHILRREAGVRDCAAFRAILRTPGSGGPYLRRRREPVRLARFDVAILLEADPRNVESVRTSTAYGELEALLRQRARHVYFTRATNVKRIGPVDHSRDGVFLFNFFVADRSEQNIAVWHYTAGWFQQETGLDNSTVLLPTPNHPSEYSLINHCRWNRLRDILPSLIFKWSFRTYVLAHFDANDTAPMAILYRLA
jgi:hypothetical protein